MTRPGTFVVSIDLELAWGVCDRPLAPEVRRALDRERTIVPRLLALFHRYDIRATWAVVAHLLVGDCRTNGAGFHPDIAHGVPRPGGRSWFFQHPAPGDRLWYAPELVELVRLAVPRQEIASHSFAHVPYDEGRTTAAAAEADIEAARAVHRALGLPFDSFVFPRNVVGHRDALGRAGIRAYRGRLECWHHRLPWRRLRGALNLLQLCSPTAPPTGRARVDETGLVDVPASMLLYGRRGLRRLVPRRLVRARAVAGLRRAARRGETFHLWFHPANFAHDSAGQFETLERILAHARALAESGRLEVATMGDIARRLADEPAPTGQPVERA